MREQPACPTTGHMSKNALTEVEWVQTTSGAKTVLDVLRSSDEIEGLASHLNALEMSATQRLLTHVFALVARQEGQLERIESGQAPTEKALDAVFEQLAASSDVFDDQYPFFQQPTLAPDRGGKKGDPDPAGVLSPVGMVQRAKDFWNLRDRREDTLPLEGAILLLVTHAFYSPLSNARYNGAKMLNGAPGYRFHGTGENSNTATEVLWRGGNLLQTLALNTPLAWVEDSSLPAWADREGKTRSSGSVLWDASWSPQAPACVWSEDALLGAWRGGVPSGWMPIPGATKDQMDKWVNTRNESDPCYLYRPNKQGELKAYRLDVSRDLSDLAINWNSEGIIGELRKNSARIIRPSRESKIVFSRLVTEGTGSSPQIRAADILVGDQCVWAPNPQVSAKVSAFADLLLGISGEVAKPFSEPSKSDLAKAATHPLVSIKQLEDYRADVLAIYWRNISALFTSFAHDPDMEVDFGAIVAVAMSAFDQVAHPHLTRYGPQLFYSRSQVRRNIYHKINKQKELENA